MDPQRWSARSVTAWAAVVIAAVGLVLGTVMNAGGVGAAAPPGAEAAPPGTPSARTFAGDRTVGPLFAPGSPTHSCTASVVDSPVGNLLITATHCVSGSAAGYTFAPGYDDGIEPYGLWTVVGAYVDPAWIAHPAPELDVAFLVVAPRRLDGVDREIQSVTGGDRLGPAPAVHHLVTVPAYGAGRNDAPITCTAPVFYDGVYPAFTCTPYPDGTSGSPWLVRSDHGWVVVGVIGGLHQGGCTLWTSYSAPFGPSTTRTYQGATAGHRTTVLPPPVGDGCTTGL